MKQPKFLPEIAERISRVKEELVLKHSRCGGTGYISSSDSSNVVYRCGCMIVFRYLKELIKSGIPQDYWNLKLDDLEIEDKLIKTIFKKYIDNLDRAKSRGIGFLLYGSNGTGKSSLMIEVGKAAIIKGHAVRYFTLSSYIDSLFRRDTERVEYYEQGDFLLIDELDKKGGAVSKPIDEFLRRMFNLNKSLLLGTNWEETELASSLGESARSLLKRRCEFVQVGGKDYSDELQDSILDRLLEEYDYFDPNIVEMAVQREKNQNG